MVIEEPEPSKRGAKESGLFESHRTEPETWGRRDWIAAVALFLATAGVVLWQNAHVAVLFDLSYILNTAARIAAARCLTAIFRCRMRRSRF